MNQAIRHMLDRYPVTSVADRAIDIQQKNGILTFIRSFWHTKPSNSTHR